MNHTCRRICVAIPLAITILLATAPATAAPPNIMVFLVDDMGVMDTSVAFLTDGDGNPKHYPLNDYYRTPAMERLAKQGVRFNQFYAMSVCSPTRVSIMTGQNAARHRVTNWINPKRDNGGPNGAPDWNWAGLKKADVTLPGLLREAGYRTIHVGKGHFGPEEHEGEFPDNLGFDVNVAGHSWGAPGSYYGEKHYGNLSNRKDRAVPGLEKYHGTKTFLSEALTLEAKQHVTDTVKQGQPFYLYFAHYAVHAPFNSDPRFAPNYEKSDKSPNAKAFATLIEGMDKSLGDMLDHLKELGVAKNTLVLFVGDNGSDAPLGHQHQVACAAPLRGKKGAHYEGGMRVPFIAAWAEADASQGHQQKLGIKAGAIQDQVASVVDIFPTVLEAAGVDSPSSHAVDGFALQTLLTGKRDGTRKEQFLMHYPHGPHRSNYFTTWRDGDWKAIFHALPKKPAHGGHIQAASHYELFNLKDDPFEQNDLADSNPDQLRKMMQGMIAELKRHKAVYPKDDAGQRVPPRLP